MVWCRTGHGSYVLLGIVPCRTLGCRGKSVVVVVVVIVVTIVVVVVLHQDSQPDAKDITDQRLWCAWLELQSTMQR